MQENVKKFFKSILNDVVLILKKAIFLSGVLANVLCLMTCTSDCSNF